MAGRIECDIFTYLQAGEGGHPGYLVLEELLPESEDLPIQQTTPFLRIVDDIVKMHNKKQKDYGREGDPFANVRASADFGIEGWIGCLIRANDKMRRLQKAAQGGQLVNESVEDSMMDLAVYAIIALVLYRETHPATI